ARPARSDPRGQSRRKRSRVAVPLVRGTVRGGAALRTHTGGAAALSGRKREAAGRGRRDGDPDAWLPALPVVLRDRNPVGDSIAGIRPSGAGTRTGSNASRGPPTCVVSSSAAGWIGCSRSGVANRASFKRRRSRTGCIARSRYGGGGGQPSQDPPPAPAALIA